MSEAQGSVANTCATATQGLSVPAGVEPPRPKTSQVVLPRTSSSLSPPDDGGLDCRSRPDAEDLARPQPAVEVAAWLPDLSHRRVGLAAVKVAPSGLLSAGPDGPLLTAASPAAIRQRGPASAAAPTAQMTNDYRATLHALGADVRRCPQTSQCAGAIRGGAGGVLNWGVEASLPARPNVRALNHVPNRVPNAAILTSNNLRQLE